MSGDNSHNVIELLRISNFPPRLSASSFLLFPVRVKKITLRWRLAQFYAQQSSGVHVFCTCKILVFFFATTQSPTSEKFLTGQALRE